MSVFADLPLIEEAVHWAQEGIATGASTRNWASYGESVSLPADLPVWQQKVLTDPQTSGGLLVSCAPEALDTVLECFQVAGFAEAKVIGRMQEGSGLIVREA